MGEHREKYPNRPYVLFNMLWGSAVEFAYLYLDGADNLFVKALS